MEKAERRADRPCPDDLARELAWQPGITARLLAGHVADESGRCRACTQPGTGLPGERWPCALYFYAEAAARIARWHGVDPGPHASPRR